MPHLGGVSTRPTLNTAKHAWQELRLSLPWVQAILWKYHPTFLQRRASNAALAKHERVLPFEDEPNVYPESLRETLDAHREANRASLIYKVPEVGKKQPLVLGSPLNETPRNNPSEGFHKVLRLKFIRANRQQGEKGGRKKTSFESAGESRGLVRQWRHEPSAPLLKRLPWLQGLSAASDSPSAKQCRASERLTSEILAFHDYILPKPHELVAAERAIVDLRSCITSINASVQVDLIGSRRTGLATALSDFDLNITHPDRGNSTGFRQDREQAHDLLQSLWRKMPKRRNFVTASAFLDRARVPIIIGVHHPTNLKFQIQCTSDAFNSMRYAQDCVAQYPTLRPLYMVLRQMLEIRGLNIGRMGGIGSYPLLIMIVAALKFSEAKIGRREAGKQLCFFLDMYSKIDFYTTAISLDPLEYVLKSLPTRTKPDRKPASSSDSEPDIVALQEPSEDGLEGRRWLSQSRSKQHMMCLQDPSNPGHDLGKQVRLIKDVQALLIETNMKLRESMDIWDTTDWTQGAGIKSKVALLDWCLAADHEIYGDERWRLNAWGQTHMQMEPSQVVGATSKVFVGL